MLQARLKVVGGRHHGKTIPLGTKKFLIGREQDCQLRPNSELVSRHHCVLAVDDFAVRIRDLGSTNGTFVNDQRIRGEVVLNAGDRIRVGKLDFQLAVGEPAVAGDSSQALTGTIMNAAMETSAMSGTDTSFEIPVPAVEDTGSSILPNEGDTPVPTGQQPPSDSTVVWNAPPATTYGSDPYAPMGMPYPQGPYQPAFHYMPPGMGYQPPMYPQIPMGYPGMYPQGGMYGQPPMYAPPPPAAEPIVEEEEEDDMPAVRLPDPKTTGAKAAAPPPPPPPPPPEPVATGGNGEAGDEGKPATPPPGPPVNPSKQAADILKNYTQRRPV